jgi:hypothetical protein
MVPLAALRLLDIEGRNKSATTIHNHCLLMPPKHSPSNIADFLRAMISPHPSIICHIRLGCSDNEVHQYIYEQDTLTLMEIVKDPYSPSQTFV